MPTRAANTGLLPARARLGCKTVLLSVNQVVLLSVNQVWIQVTALDYSLATTGGPVIRGATHGKQPSAQTTPPGGEGCFQAAMCVESAARVGAGA